MKRIIILIIVSIIISSLSYAMAYDSLNGLDFNDDLYEQQGIRVFGDYKDIEENDFAKVNEGYYNYLGLFGEFRYHGFDINFNPYANLQFPNDKNSYISLSNKNWIEKGWEEAGYSSDLYYRYLSVEPDSQNTYFLKEAYRHMLPFEIYQVENVYNYLYIKDFPTIISPGEGIMWHETENGRWYQSFSLNPLEDKLQTDLLLDFDVVNEKDFDYITESKKLELELVSTLNDNKILKDSILKSIYYNREDIDYFVFEIDSEIFTVYANENFNSSRLELDLYLNAHDLEVGYKDLCASVYIVYLNGKNSETVSFNKRIEFSDEMYLLSYFNTSNILIDDEVKRENVKYFDLSEGDIFTYIINFKSSEYEKEFIIEDGIDNEIIEDYLFDFINQYEIKPYVPIEINQKVIGFLGESTHFESIMIVNRNSGIEMEFDIPSKCFDLMRIDASNLTDMSNVMDKEVWINDEKVNFNYFFSGQYIYGKIDEDVLIPIDVCLTAWDGTKYNYHSWIMIQTTKVRINFHQSEKAIENEPVLFVSKEELANSSDLLNSYSVNYKVITNGNGKIQNIGKNFYITYDKPGIYKMTIIADNGIQTSRREYRIVVNEDLLPVLYLNLDNNQIYRGESLSIHYDGYSPDGDDIESIGFTIFEDLNGDTIYESSYPYYKNHIYNNLGYYKIVGTIEEENREATVSRDFVVDNKMPLTTLNLDKLKSPEKIDVLFVVEGDMNFSEKEEIYNEYKILEDELMMKGYDSNVDFFFEGMIHSERELSIITDTNENYPSDSYIYSEDGFYGKLDLDSVEDFGYYEDLGSYKTVRTCREVPVYEYIRSCSICGTYINAIGYKMCKFCYAVTGTTIKCTTRSYWVPNIVWINDYRGYYSGIATKDESSSYHDDFRVDARKVILIVDGDSSDVELWENLAEEVYAYDSNQIDEIFLPSENYPYVYLVDEPFELLTGNFDFESDPIVNELYLVNHQIDVFDNCDEVISINGEWLNEKVSSLSLPGIYEIRKKIFDSVNPDFFSKQSNEANVFLKVHRPPIADYIFNQSTPLEIVDCSYDLDYEFSREDKGIVETKLIITDEMNNKLYQLPSSLELGEYTFDYYAKDIDGAWGSKSKTIVISNQYMTISAKATPIKVSIEETVLLKDIMLIGSGMYKFTVEVTNNKNVNKLLTTNYYYISSAGYSPNDISWTVLNNSFDGDYFFKLTLVNYFNPSQKAIYYVPFDVSSPIDLEVFPLGEINLGDVVTIKAVVAPYVNDVRLLMEGNEYPMSYINGVWQREYLMEEEIELKVKANLNNNFVIKPVEYEISEMKQAELTIKGLWNYWRGQVNILGERVENDSMRFMAFEKVLISLKVDDIDDNPILCFDPRLDISPKVMQKHGKSYNYDWRIPLVGSTINEGNNKLEEPYYIEAYFGDEIIREYFNITGNTYDRLYLQPQN